MAKDEVPYIIIGSWSRFDWIAKPMVEAINQSFTKTILLYMDSEEDCNHYNHLKHDAFGVIWVTVHPLKFLKARHHDLRQDLDAGIPMVIWNVDHSAVTYHHLPSSHPKLAYLHVDPLLSEFWHKIIDDTCLCDETISIGAHPHAAVWWEKDGDELLTKKQNNILISMNMKWVGWDYDAFQADLLLQPVHYQHILEALRPDRLDPKSNPLSCVEAMVEELNLESTREEIARITRFVVFDWHLWRRNELIRRALNFPVLITGNYLAPQLATLLEDKAKQHPVRFIKDVSVAETIELNIQSRLCVTTSFSPNFLHDRTINASLLHTATLAENNLAFSSFYDANTEVLLYDYQPNSIEEMLDYAISNPDSIMEIAANARKK